MKLHRCRRAEPLIALLADRLRAPRDPFAAVTVVVPGKPVGRWLSMAVAQRLGVVAQVRWVPLVEWLRSLLGAALPDAATALWAHLDGADAPALHRARRAARHAEREALHGAAPAVSAPPTLVWAPAGLPALARAVLPGLDVEVFAPGAACDWPDHPAEVAPDPHADAPASLLACAGPLRQVEAVRDALLRCLADHPELQPHQIGIYAPEPAAAAPFVAAVFGDPPPGTEALHWGLAERPRGAENPVADVLGALLGLAGGRMTANDLLGLVRRPIVRRRFGFADDDVPQLEAWVVESGIRWGVDADHRVERGQPREARNTWRFGLDRLLLGCAMPDERGAPWRGVVPFDAVEGRVTGLLGRFADCCERLFGHLADWQTAADGPAWRARLTAAVDDLCAHGADDHDAHRSTRALLDRLRAAPTLERGAVQAWFAGLLAEPVTTRRFLGGGITLAPLRADAIVPFDVVVVMGLGAGVYPRPEVRAPEALDVAAPVNPDVAAFEAARVAAKTAFIVAYDGLDPYDGTARTAPAVLRRLMAQGVEVARVPLRPWSGTHTYDAREAEAAAALAAAPARPQPFVPGLLPPPDDAELGLAQLASFYKDPLAAFTRRLGLFRPEAAARAPDREPLAVDPLTRWGLGEQLFQRRLAQQAAKDARAAVVAGGEVPFGVAGGVLLDALGRDADAVASLVETYRAGAPLPPIDVDVPVDGLRLTGRIDGLWGPGLLLHQSGKVRAHHLMKAWIHHLAMHHVPSFPGHTLLVGRADSRRGEPAAFEFGPVLDPGGLLAQLVDGWRRGLQAPLPLLANPSMAYAEAARRSGAVRGRDVDRVRRFWGWAVDRDPLAQRLVGRHCPLLESRPAPGALAPLDAPLAAMAQQVWGPLVAAVRRRSRP